jgi:hypothetical protein
MVGAAFATGCVGVVYGGFLFSFMRILFPDTLGSVADLFSSFIRILRVAPHCKMSFRSVWLICTLLWRIRSVSCIRRLLDGKNTRMDDLLAQLG